MKKTRKSKAELRIEIAKDVLKHIESEKITAKIAYCYFDTSSKAMFRGEQLQDVLPKIKKCTICALGGLFYAYVERHNNFKLDTSSGLQSLNSRPTKMRDSLTMFTHKQLLMIESAFESKDMDARLYYSDVSETSINKALSFRRRNSADKLIDAKETLTLIMKNIIHNKGTFKP